MGFNRKLKREQMRLMVGSNKRLWLALRLQSQGKDWSFLKKEYTTKEVKEYIRSHTNKSKIF